jgi:hypothetical protein
MNINLTHGTETGTRSTKLLDEVGVTVFGTQNLGSGHWTTYSRDANMIASMTIDHLLSITQPFGETYIHSILPDLK